MPTKSKKPEPASGSGKKVFFSILLIAVSVYYAYGKFSAMQPNAAINNGVTDEMPRASREEMIKNYQTAATAAGVSPEKQKIIQEAFENAAKKAEAGGSGWAAFGEAMQVARDNMTEDQQKKVRDAMGAERAKRDAKLKAALGDAQYKRLQEKRAERRGGNRGQGNRGGGGGDRQRRDGSGSGSGSTNRPS